MQSPMQKKLADIHYAIMQGAIGPGEALVRGRASRALLVESVKQLKFATKLLEEIIGGEPVTGQAGRSSPDLEKP